MKLCEVLKEILKTNVMKMSIKKRDIEYTKGIFKVESNRQQQKNKK